MARTLEYIGNDRSLEDDVSRVYDAEDFEDLKAAVLIFLGKLSLSDQTQTS